MKIVVVGSGNVAESLAQAVAEADGLELVQLFARNEVRGRKVRRFFNWSFLFCELNGVHFTLRLSFLFNNGLIAQLLNSYSPV